MRREIKVATDNATPQFAIERNASALLREMSGEFSETILRMAAKNTAGRTPSGMPLVDSCDIADAAETLCQSLKQLQDCTPHLSDDQKQAMLELQTFCQVFAEDCRGAE